MTLCGSKPSGTFCNCQKLRRRSPAPTRRTKASTISAVDQNATQTAAAGSFARPAATFVQRRDHIGPRNSPGGRESEHDPGEQTNECSEGEERRSGEISSTRGKFCGSKAASASVPQSASNIPAAPPRMESNALSVSNWRKIRARLAPRAARMPISFSRAVARARRRLATLTQAIRSTQPAAASRTIRAGRTSEVRSARSGRYPRGIEALVRVRILRCGAQPRWSRSWPAPARR